jgi:hypothetical protein
MFALLSVLAGCSRQSLNENVTLNPTAATIYVATTGSNTTTCGPVATPCATIAYAVGRVNGLGAANAPGSVIIVKNGTYNETSRSTLTVSGTTANPITLKAENVVTSTTAAKNVTINYTGPAMGYAQGVIEGNSVSNWIIEGFKIQSAVDSVTVTYGSTTNTIPLPRMVAGILFRNGDNITVRYNHTFKTGISGIIFMPASLSGCPDGALPGFPTLFYFDTTCAVQNTGNKVLYNKVELPNQGWKSGSNLQWEQESLTMWGVDNFEVAYNLVVSGTKEGIDVKLGRNGTIHDNIVDGVGTGIPTMNIAENGVGIYLDGRAAPMYNIQLYRNIVKNNKNVGISILTERPFPNSTVINGTAVTNEIYDIKVYNNIVHGNKTVGLQLGDRVGRTNNTFTVDIYHNTFAENNLGFIIKTYYPASSPHPDVKPHHVTIRNNIFANSGANGQAYIENANNIIVDDNFVTWVNNSAVFDFQASTTSALTNTNNILAQVTSTDRANPGFNPTKFVSMQGATYYLALQSNSPAINQGDTNVGPAPTAFAGNARPSSYTASGLPPAAPDMGAYEYQ